MNATAAAVCLEVTEAGLGVVTLTQPDRGNLFDAPFVREMRDVFLQLWNTPNLRAVLLRAQGRNFSLGGDLKFFYAQRAQLAPIVHSLTADLHMALQRAWRLPVPMVAEVQGFALGGAVALFAGADVVVAGQSARIGSAFTQIGFSCDSGTTVALTARMGAARAKRFVMLAEVLDSAQACQAGLVDKVVADDALSGEALALARQLAAGPTVALGEIKRLFMRAGAIEMEALLEDEALTLARVAATHDAQEGIAAQQEKRRPVFQGR